MIFIWLGSSKASATTSHSMSGHANCSVLKAMAGALQPIGMTAAIMEKRLHSASPDLEALIKSCGNVKTLSREASSTFVDLMTWLAPKGLQRMAVNAGIEDTVGMVSTELAFRGFALINQTAGISEEMPQNILRSVYLAGLIALTDAAQSAGQVTLKAQLAGDEILLEMQFTAVGHESVQDGVQAYRKLEWHDVHFLAQADGVGFEQTSTTVAIRVGRSSIHAVE